MELEKRKKQTNPVLKRQLAAYQSGVFRRFQRDPGLGAFAQRHVELYEVAASHQVVHDETGRHRRYGYREEVDRAAAYL